MDGNTIFEELTNEALKLPKMIPNEGPVTLTAQQINMEVAKRTRILEHQHKEKVAEMEKVKMTLERQIGILEDQVKDAKSSELQLMKSRKIHHIPVEEDLEEQKEQLKKELEDSQTKESLDKMFDLYRDLLNVEIYRRALFKKKIEELSKGEKMKEMEEQVTLLSQKFSQAKQRKDWQIIKTDALLFAWPILICLIAIWVALYIGKHYGLRSLQVHPNIN